MTNREFGCMTFVVLVVLYVVLRLTLPYPQQNMVLLGSSLGTGAATAAMLVIVAVNEETLSGRFGSAFCAAAGVALVVMMAFLYSLPV